MRIQTERMHSMVQNLTFEHTKDAFTNLALLLSDQCEHTIKIAVFADESKTKFKDSKEFGGSVLQQTKDAFSYLMLCNQHPAELKGLRRVEHPDYPEESLREALLNAIVHRDYSFSGSIIINITDIETEFISIGGLLPGLSTEDILSGISQPRNAKLAEIFHRLHLIESYGTGIRRIYSLYKDCPSQPRIEVTPNAFKIVLPNLNHTAVNTNDISQQEQKIIDFISAHGFATDDDVQKAPAHQANAHLCNYEENA